ncbi:DUF4871 domain-containing protein [Bacillus sp. FJAT-27245]|uniref:DUF4871 domain-containing protein n=1 Tax=Bacillus sp. FJAT-27245 TaxID=1684144 RepID=UPI0006A7A0E6|nr:DUF4871 domain-containing protein [Bacillus sp. FJAT-27245]
MKNSKRVIVSLCLLSIFYLSGCIKSNKENVSVNANAGPVKGDTHQWDRSPEFKSSEGDYLIGEEGKVGIVGPEFVAGETNKWLWHFWGDEQTIEDGDFKVVAIHKETGVKEKALVENAGTPNKKKVWNYGKLSYGPNGVRGSDSSKPSNMSLSKPGLWRLEVSIGDKKIGAIVVDVKER